MKLDDVDIKILEVLQNDARKSLREIAKEVGASTPTVSAKLNTLTQLGVIKGFRTIIDADKLGETTVLLMVKSKPSDVDKVAKKLKKIGSVRELLVLSSSLIEIKATFTESSEVNNLLSSLSSIPEIQEYEYYTVLKAIKEEQRALVKDDISLLIECFYCRKPMHDAPVKLKIDGRDHYLCCNTCKREYKKKYEDLKSKA
jgi:DNA-binding Lrp family transcriptional regulator